jgi:secretion/DNA translocation related TadE-like protein
VTVLLAGVLVLVCVLVMATVDIFRAVHGGARAQAAADAAALAAAQEMVLGASAPAEPAAAYAGRNGAVLRWCKCQEGTGEAVVEVEVFVSFIMLGPDRPVRARARAVVEGLPRGSA